MSGISFRIRAVPRNRLPQIALSYPDSLKICDSDIRTEIIVYDEELYFRNGHRAPSPEHQWLV